MQAGLRVVNLFGKLNEMKQALAVMNRLEKLVLGMNYDVS